MLLKLIGIILIILSGSMLGVNLSREYEMRISQLKQFKKMLVLLKGEINYNNSGISESVCVVAERIDNNIGTFLKTVINQFEECKCTLKEAWDYGVENELKANTKLKDKELMYIKDLGINLGVTDRETQINNILNCIDAINMLLEELNENRVEKCKLYKTLGVMASAFLTIVLI